jgi:hypothetical protein
MQLFIKPHQLFMLMLALSSISIDASLANKKNPIEPKKYLGVVMPAPELGGTSNLFFTMINNTKSKTSFHHCSDDDAQNLAINGMRQLMSNPSFLNQIKQHKPRMLATIRHVTFLEFLINPNEKFAIDIEINPIKLSYADKSQILLI